MESLAKRFKKIRKKKGISQEKLAELAGVTRRTISHYETECEKPTIENLKAIAKTLNVSIDYLLDYKIAKQDVTSELQLDSRTAEKIKIILALPKNLRSMVYILAESLMAREKLKEQEIKNNV